ncbi:hypothetical protein [Sphingomonas sp.]|uniref:helix-turn-helix transcriptional regulator n=1 Tax=Sphingomonas sp. TaxID=28214 RepID=UPI001ED652F5|nr:hypothetical protein [Sphingomonas sp.]MBX3594084.1 hypothetical protein [Sphingomonas sp.]
MPDLLNSFRTCYDRFEDESMLTHDLHESIVAQLYSAAAGDIEWREIMGRIADLFGHAAAVLVAIDPAAGSLRAHTHGYTDDEANAYYQSETFRADPRASLHMGVRAGEIYHDRALYDVPTMLRDERVRASIDAIGVAHQMGLSLRLPNNLSGAFTLLSTEAEGMPTDEGLAAFHRLAPHVEQACALSAIIEQAAGTQAVLLEALSAKADGVIIVDASERLAFVNDGARAILAAGDGLGWSDGQFATARAAETRRLRAMVNGVTSALKKSKAPDVGGQIVVTRPSGRKPYVVRVLAAPPGERLLSHFGCACVVHVHDLAAVRVPNPAMLSATFGLSEREARLAAECIRYADLSAAAAAIGMAHNTARNHLQSIFRKCGVHSQAEAVQLFGRLG